MPATSTIAYLRSRLIEAQTQNADDSRAARTPEERAFVNGQRHLLQAFSAWLDLAESGHGFGCQHGGREP
jgi:hypothetical protein